jgi:muconate cycloisomerase
MKIVAATVYALRIPFRAAFRHASAERAWSDSVVVGVEDDRGTLGHGEGVARPYVTGETVETVLAHLADDLWPAIAGQPVPPVRVAGDLARVERLLPPGAPAGIRWAGASRAALELAILDCALRREGRGLGDLLRPCRAALTYSGVVGTGSVEAAIGQARQLRAIGCRDVKVKVGAGEDVARVRAVREALGPEAVVRLDANGAWSAPRALETLGALAPYRIAGIEEPLAPGPVAELARFRAASPVPVFADESAVTAADAEALIAARAVDGLNVRVSKHGGLARALAIAERARAAGLAVQVGSHVGETAILAAAGRHLAATLPDLAALEGSFGSLLLEEDVSPDGVRFGHGGRAAPLRGPGLGVRVLEERLRRHAWRIVRLGEARG